MVHHLASQSDLNGEDVELLEFCTHRGRWAAKVRSSGKRIWIRSQCLRAEEVGDWRQGQRATLRNLVAREDLNGREVEILKWVPSSGRWAVRELRSEAQICVRPTCLLELSSQGCSRAREKEAEAHALHDIVCRLSGGKLALEQRQGRGNCVIAMEKVRRGTVLFRETPWLRMPTLRNGGVSMAAVARLAREVREDNERCSLFDALHDGGLCRSEFMDRADMAAEEAARSVVPLDGAWLKRFWRVWNLNAFTFHGTNMALFLGGSMFNHSCHPNAIYQTISHMPDATFRAIQDLEVGDEVTVDYTTTQDPSCEARHRQLFEEKLFVCACNRCLQPDWPRSICCRSSGCTGTVAPPDWHCWECRKSFQDTDMPLQAESWIKALVLDHDVRHSQYTHEHFVATLLLALDVLGPRHWTVKFMACLLLENACSKGCRGISSIGPSLLCLPVSILCGRRTWCRQSKEQHSLWAPCISVSEHCRRLACERRLPPLHAALQASILASGARMIQMPPSCKACLTWCRRYPPSWTVFHGTLCPRRCGASAL